MNEALSIKHLHKLYNKEDIPWVHSFGTHIMEQDKFHMPQLRKGFSGYGMLWNSVITLGAQPPL